MMRKEKLQTQTVYLPAGTVAGTYEFTVLGGFAILGLSPFEMDNNFKRVSGISFQVVSSDSNPGTKFRISIKDSQDYFLSNARIDFLAANNVPESNERFMEYNLKAKGNRMFVTLIIPAPIINAYTLDIIYKLDNEDHTARPRIKYDARNVTVAAGSTPYQTILKMDIYYRQITALCLFVFFQMATTDYLRLNFFDTIGEFIGMVPQAELQSSIDRSMEKNFTKVEFVRSRDNAIMVQFTSPSILGNPIDSDIIFKLEA